MTGHDMTLDGYLDCEIVTDGGPGTPTRFRLICQSTDETVDELIMPCTVTDPVMARDLCRLMVGDRLRVTGSLHIPQQPDAPVWLAVAHVVLLCTAPLLNPTDTHGDHPDIRSAGPGPEDSALPIVDRYADYFAVHDPDAGRSFIWHTSGIEIGHTDDPAAIGDLIEAHERRTDHGEA